MRRVWERVPVEIWHYILEEVISVPYLLDVVCPADCDSYYEFSALTINPGPAYEEAEQARLNIEQVCIAWKEFSQSTQLRFMTGTHRLLLSTKSEPSLRHVLRLQIASNAALSLKLREMAPNSLLRRLDVYSKDALTLNNLLPLVASFTRLRSLTLRVGNATGHPPVELSLPVVMKQLERLQTLVVVFDGSINWRGKASMEDVEVFEVHGLNHVGIGKVTPGTYQLPKLRHLYVGALREASHFTEILEYLQAGPGKSLRSLSIKFQEGYRGGPVYMPLSFWATCPKLTEFGTDFGLVNFDSVPADSHIRYLVHRSSKISSPKLLSNLELFLSIMRKNLHSIIFAQIFDWGTVQNAENQAAITRIFNMCPESCGVRLLNWETKAVPHDL